MARLHAYLTASVVASVMRVFLLAVLPLFVIPELVRLRGWEDYGALSFVLGFSGFGGLAAMGVSKAMVVRMAQATDTEGRSVTFMNGLVLTACIAVPMAALVGVTSWYAVAGADAELLLAHRAEFVWYGLVYLVAITLFGAIVSAYESIERYHWGVYGFLGWTLLIYSLAYACFSSGLDVPMTVGLLSLAAVLMVVLAMVVVMRTADVRLRWFDLETLRSLMPVAARFAVLGIVVSMTEPLMRLVFLRAGGSLAEYGSYDLAMRLTQGLASVVLSLGLPMLGVVARMDQAEPERSAALVWKVCLLAAALSAFLWLASYLLLDQFVLLLDLPPSILVPVALLLLLGLLANAVAEPVQRALMARERIRHPLISRLLILMLAFWVLLAGGEASSAQHLALAYAMALLAGALYLLLAFWRSRGVVNAAP